MSSMTIPSLVLRIRTLMDEAPDYNAATNDIMSGQEFDSSIVVDAINHAIRTYCRKRKNTLTVSTATISTAGLVTVPSDYLSFEQVAAANTLLTETTHEHESLRDVSWETSTSTTARKWLLRDGRNIQLTPLVSAWSTGLYTASMSYIQAPKVITSVSAVTAGSFVVGQWYQIVSVGDTTFTTVGASASTVGVQFQATGVGSGTGTAYEIVDPRIAESDQEYLKYEASAFLLHIRGDAASVVKAEKFSTIFGFLVGV